MLIVSDGAGHRVSIMASPAGGAGSLPFELAISADRQVHLLLLLERGMAQTRRLSPPETVAAAAAEVGGALFEALFHGQLREVRSLDRGDLRIRLRLKEVPDLAWLPWELLYDSRANRFFQTFRKHPDRALPPPAARTRSPGH